MKKFLVICLSVVMLFSTMLLTGFASYQELEEDLQPISIDGGYVGTVYFDTTKTVEEMNIYFSTLPFSLYLPVLPFIISDDSYALVVMAVGDNNFILLYDTFSNIMQNGPTEENLIFSSSIGWVKSSIDVNNFVLKSVKVDFSGSQLIFDVVDSSYFAKTDYPKVGFSIVTYPFIVPTQSGLINIYFNAYMTVTETEDYLNSVFPVNADKLVLYESSTSHLIVYKDNNNDYLIIAEDSDGHYDTIFSSSRETFNLDYGPLLTPVDIGWYESQYQFIFDINDYTINPILNSSLFSSYPIEYTKNESFVNSFLNVLKSVFVDYPLILAGGFVSMFTSLFWYQGTLTIVGNIFIIFLGMSLVSSIFYTVFNIFKGKIKKRL